MVELVDQLLEIGTGEFPFKGFGRGQTPGETLAASRRFPEMFANQYVAGEISGKLDDTLRRLHQYYQDEGSRKLQSLTQWVPRLIYLMVMLIIAFKVIRFWTGYFNQINGIMGG